MFNKYDFISCRVSTETPDMKGVIKSKKTDPIFSFKIVGVSDDVYALLVEKNYNLSFDCGIKNAIPSWYHIFGIDEKYRDNPILLINHNDVLYRNIDYQSLDINDIYPFHFYVRGILKRLNFKLVGINDVFYVWKVNDSSFKLHESPYMFSMIASDINKIIQPLVLRTGKEFNYIHNMDGFFIYSRRFYNEKI